MHKSQVNFALSLLTTFVFTSTAVPVRYKSLDPSYLDQSVYGYDFESRKTDSLMKPVASAKVRRNEPQNLQTLNQEVPNYDFEYQIHGGGNIFGHVEKRRESTTNGKYYVILPDFRRQVVSYYADETGYHATITYEPLPRPPNSIDTERLERRKPAFIPELGNKLGNNPKEQRRVITRTNNKKQISKNGQEEVQHRKQTRETPAEQILYALAQFEEHQHRQKNRSSSRRSYRGI